MASAARAVTPRRVWLVAASLGAAVLGVTWWAGHSRPVLHVPRDHPTIAAALTAAPNGAVIEVGPGVYEESLVIERPVTIQGPTNGKAEVRGDVDGPTISILGVADVTLRRLTITRGEIGVLVQGSEGVLLADNVIVGSRWRGVKVVYGSARSWATWSGTPPARTASGSRWPTP